MSYKFYYLKIINGLLLALVAAVPLFFVKAVMYPFIIPKTVLFEGLAELMVALWLGLAIADKAFRPRWFDFAHRKWDFLTGAVLAFGGILTAASVFGADFLASMWSTPARGIGLFAWWHFIALFIALSSLGRGIRWNAVWWTSLATSSVCAAGAILSSYSSRISAFFLQPVAGLRTGSTFNNPTFLAGYLLLNVFIGVWIFSRHPSLRWLAALLIAVDGIGILFTQTLGDIAGLTAGVVVCLLALAIQAHSKGLKNAWGWVFAGLIVLTAVVWVTRDAPLWRHVPGLSRLSDSQALSQDLQFRAYAWQAGLQAFQEKPWLGWGWENFNLAFEKHYNPRLLTASFDETYWDKPHNLYVEYLVVAGVPGLLAFLALMGAAGAAVWKARKKGKGMAPAFFGLLAAYMLRSFVIFDTIGPLLMLFLVLSYLAGEAEGSVQDQAPKSAPKNSSMRFQLLPPLFAAGALLLIYYFGVLTWKAQAAEYNGLNDSILRDVGDAAIWYERAVAVPEPYRDFVQLDFASTVENSFQSNVPFPDVVNLQKKLAEGLRTVISRHPLNYFYYSFLAEYENTFHQFDPAYLKDAEVNEAKALALSPDRQQVYYVVAKTELWEGRTADAYQTFKHVIQFNPEAADPYFYLGLLEYQQGNAPEGASAIQKALLLGRDVKTAQEAEALATAMGDVGHDYQGAVEYYRKALQLVPRGINPAEANGIQLRLALAQYYAGDKNGSAETFRSLMKNVDLKNSPVYGSLAPILEDVGISP